MRQVSPCDEHFLNYIVTSASNSGKPTRECSFFINELGLSGSRGVVLVLILTWEINAIVEDIILLKDLKEQRPDIFTILSRIESYREILDGADPGEDVDTLVVGVFPKWEASGIFTVSPILTKMT
jgi:hypothetical protein